MQMLAQNDHCGFCQTSSSNTNCVYTTCVDYVHVPASNSTKCAHDLLQRSACTFCTPSLQSITQTPEGVCDSAFKANVVKNRYANIFPCELHVHTVQYKQCCWTNTGQCSYIQSDSHTKMAQHMHTLRRHITHLQMTTPELCWVKGMPMAQTTSMVSTSMWVTNSTGYSIHTHTHTHTHNLAGIHTHARIHILHSSYPQLPKLENG